MLAGNTHMALKVMAVDDEANILKMFRVMVEPLGYEVHTFQDSRDASRALQDEKFDGVFLDLRMPYLDGLELTRQIRASAQNHDIPVIMLTGYDDVETMRRGFKAGISMFLGKPFTQERLSRLLNAVRGAMIQEKRSCARLPFRTIVLCRYHKHTFRASSINLGENGILIDTSGGLEVGQEFTLELALPDIPGLSTLHGRVVRKEPPDRMGVQFINLGQDAREAIHTFIFGE
jgi:CheY-like chemotaxis protein